MILLINNRLVYTATQYMPAIDRPLSDRSATAILPVTIDNAPNREGMPDADWSAWTDPKDIAEELFVWAETAAGGRTGAGRVPENGSCVQVLNCSRNADFFLPNLLLKTQR